VPAYHARPIPRLLYFLSGIEATECAFVLNFLEHETPPFAVKISACLIVCNEEKNLARCLRSVAPVTDEIVVIDSGSADRTVEIARSFGARVIGQPWLGFVGQKNFALEQAEHPWVLSIDADEELSPELAEAVTRLREDSAAEAPGAPNGYTVSRLVFYHGKWIRHGDWYPDRLVRLFRRAEARFTGGRVHEKLEIAGRPPLLPGELHHFTYTDPADRARRSATYARLWAESAHEARRRTWPGIGASHATLRFVRGFVFKRGFLDGAAGFDVARGNAREVALKYRLLRAMEHGPSAGGA
jgi:glycosyltransferase involved in cell wall biosynthesis